MMVCTRRRRLLAALVVYAGTAVGLTSCEPTGHLRCDAHVDILDEIESHGWSVNCAPDFENRGSHDGVTFFPIWGWVDSGTQTVWIWPEEVTIGAEFDAERGDRPGEWHVTDDELRRLLWHELAHVVGITDDADADAYAYCREPLRPEYMAEIPTEDDCEELGVT